MKGNFQSRNEEFFKLSAAATAELTNKITDTREQEFHDFVREIIIYVFIYFFLYGLAFFIIKILRKSKESDEYVLDYEDAIIDRVSKRLCTFTLATGIGALLLLPMSIIANEVIKITPHSVYWKWLNSSLLHGLWNLIFLFSNLSLFVFLPFSHLFIESIGLPGSRKGLKSRVVETSLLLSLIAFCMIGISFVISAIFDHENPKSKSFLNVSNYHLPFLYSCISFIGVIFLLICTPLGFARLFTIVSNLIMKSTFRYDTKEDVDIAELEAEYINRKIEYLKYKRREMNHSSIEREMEINMKLLNDAKDHIRRLKKQSNRLTIYRNLCYPFLMIFLFVLNTFGILMVAKNTFNVIFGQLPTARINSEKNERSEVNDTFKSVYTLGIIQKTFEITLIVYFTVASLVGFYTAPFFNKLLPKYKSTTMDKIILNCAIFLIFSSALPVSSKILGLTRFDLLGHFGDLQWLSNLNIILMYNFGFAIATGVCLITKFTATVRSELYERVLILFQNALLNENASSSLFMNRTSSSTTFSSSAPTRINPNIPLNRHIY